MRCAVPALVLSSLAICVVPAWSADDAAAAPTQEQIASATAEMKAFTQAAVDHVRKVGAETAFKDFMADGGAWKKGQLYIYVYDWDGKCLSHGAKAVLVGKSLIGMQDKKGNKLIQGLRDTAKAGGGTYEFYWENPQTKKVDHKLGYALKVDDTCWLGSGIYLGEAK